MCIPRRQHTKKTLHDFKAFEQVNQGHKRCYKSESLLGVTQTPSPAPSPLLKAVKLHAGSASFSSSSISTTFIRISVVRFTKRGVRGHRNIGLVRTSAFFGVQSQWDLGHIFPLKVKQREDVKKKAMWNVQCIEVCRASFITNPPFSPVRWLKTRAECYLLASGFTVLCACLRNVWEIILSLDGKGFSPEFLFFFSLVLSKLVTSSRFGLSDMFAVGLKSNDRKWLAVNDCTRTQRGQMHADTRPLWLNIQH